MVEPARKVVVDLVVAVDPALPESLHRQVYRALRAAMLEQRLKAGAKLPSTRALALMLGVARNTIHGAYDQLLAEGYLEARHGSGTYVAASLPDEAFQPGADRARPGSESPESTLPGEPPVTGRLSAWGRRVVSIGETPYLGAPVALPYDFRHGRPDATHFPLAAWRRIAGRQLRQLDRDDLWYGPAAGLPALRSAIAEYLGRARGVRCTPEQVIITNGTQQAIDLIVRLLIDPGDVVVVEDPCYSGARRVFAAQGAALIDVPVDEHGLCVDLLPETPARLVYTTPSHQYPSGATLPVSRRLDLLRWAERQDALIVEDDYDSEFRHAGRPLEALQGLDRSGRVAYVGSFSKVLYPALRLGYLVAPVDLVRLAAEAKRLVDLQTATPGQELLAELIQGGHFEAHLRRMRRVYRGRRAALLDALAQELGPLAEPGPSDAGLYLRVVLAEGIDEDAVTREAAARGVAVYPARPYYQRPPARPGLILGYAALDEDGIREGIRRLREAVRRYQSSVFSCQATSSDT
ncbi:MAG: PLP-dependent aminotransferase family protein [Chloroflexi bacterium]|nr:PLP-dependent aminotransferase family protein [Chloroflexota bacterium]